MSDSDFLFVQPSFLRGLGRVVDLGSTLSRHSYNISSTPQEADARAIAVDVAALHQDMKAAVAKVTQSAGDVEAQER